MNMIKYVYYSLFGAWRLMRFDPKGLDWIDQTESGFWRSFLAALVGLPFFLALSGLERDLRGSQAFGIFAPLEKLDLDHYLLLQTLDYIAIWPIFAMVMILYSRWLKMSDRFVPLIVGYNWARCLSIVVPIPAYLMITLGLLNSFFALVLTMAASIFVLVYRWFVVKTALGGASLAAATVVMADILLAAGVSVGMTGLFGHFFIGPQ
jgi:hypothetical protein